MEESLEIAETLKVLNTINLEPKRQNRQSKQAGNDESVAATLKQSKRMVKEALDVSE